MKIYKQKIFQPQKVKESTVHDCKTLVYFVVLNIGTDHVIKINITFVLDDFLTKKKLQSHTGESDDDFVQFPVDKKCVIRTM